MSRAKTLALLSFTSLSLAACAGSKGDGAPPTLTVTSPDRGTTADGNTVTVTGNVTGSGVTLTVNGQATPVMADGSFSADVTLTPGIEVIETDATDDGGDVARDVRAVMSGDLQPTTGYVTDAVGAHIGAGAFNVISQVAVNAVDALDVGSLARGMNPVYNNPGSCFGAVVNVTDAQFAGVTLDLTPQAGQVAVNAEVQGLDVWLDVPYTLACFDGDDSAYVHADSIQVSGGLGLWVDANGQIQASIDNPQVTVQGLNLDVGGLPDAIVNLFDGYITGMIQNTAVTMIQEKVPGQVETMLTDMAGKTFDLSLLGKNISMGITPASVDIDSNGAFIAIDTNMVVDGGQGGVYVNDAEPLDASIMGDNSGLGLALSDNAINQLFGGLWAAGALDLTVPADNGSPIGLLFGGNTRTVKISAKLPPTASMDPSGDLRLTVGDLMIEADDAQGNPQVQMALSMTTTLGATVTADNHVQMQLGTPTAWAQIISQSPDLVVPLKDSDIEGMLPTLTHMASTMADNALAGVPLPSIMGVSLSDPQLSSHNGYVVVTTGLTLN
jgi:hypothetical protein